MMRILKRATALCFALLILMLSTADAEVPFLVHSKGWDFAAAPVEVLLKAAVDTHMPFDDDRLAMLTPITDMLSLRLVTGQDEGSVTIAVDGEDALTLQYRGNEAQLSSMPDTTYQAESDPFAALLGTEASAGSIYEMLHLSPQGESLLTDGQTLLAFIPAAFEEYGKRSANTTNISGYGQAAYRYDYTITEKQAGVVRDILLSICPEGWLREIISGLTFSGKQTLRIYYSEEDVLLRAEYNGVCGAEDDLRTVNLVYKFRHDDTMDKDYVELTSPAKKGKNKNTLNFERTVETNKKGQRVINATFDYTVTKDGVTSIRKGEAALNNAFTEEADVLTGEITLQHKLDGAEKYTALILTPDLSITGTADAPVLSGTVNVTEKYADKVTEQALVSVELKRADPLEWLETQSVVDLTALTQEELASVQLEAAASVATALVRPLILKLGAEAEWFFREMSAEAVQSIIDAAGAAE